jgi:hypothetical protein
MTRQEARECIRRPGGIDLDTVDEVFAAFGFVSSSPTFETEVYYHPRYRRCGAFTARDDGIHILTDQQRFLVARMISCVLMHEEQESHGGGKSI